MLGSWHVALSERSRWEYEYRLRSAQGEHRWVVDRGVPRYEGGSFAGYVGTAIDIHERKLMEARLREVYEREHTIAETLQRSLLPRAAAADRGRRPGGPLPARRPRGGHRRRLVRRARASGRPRGARGGRRGRPRPARCRHDGPAAQRLPRLRAGGGVAGRGRGAHQPAGAERCGGGDGHGALRGARPGDRRDRVLGRRPSPAARAGSPTAPASSRAGARCRSAPPIRRSSARRGPCCRPDRRCCSTPTAWSSAATCLARRQAGPAGHSGRAKPAADLGDARATACSPACSASATRATTWRCSPSGPSRRRPSASS